MNTFMNNLEQVIVYTRARWFLQRFWEIPIMQSLGLKTEGLNILEIGCGTGHAAYKLATKYRAASVTGVDLDTKSITQARTRYTRPQNLHFHEADATRLPFKNETFDVAISFGLLHHIPHWQTAIQEIQRVLKKNGTYALDDFTQHGLKKKYHSIFDHPRHNRFTTGDLITTLKTNHFKIKDITHRLAGDVVFAVSEKL